MKHYWFFFFFKGNHNQTNIKFNVNPFPPSIILEGISHSVNHFPGYLPIIYGGLFYFSPIGGWCFEAIQLNCLECISDSFR